MAAAPHEFAEEVATLKHDLGKYVAWMSANLDEEAWRGPLRDDLLEALRRDILRTRSSSSKGTGSEVEAAWEVWDRLTQGWPRPLAEPELVRVAEAIEVLRGVEGILRSGDRTGLAGARSAIRTAQQTIRSSLQQLHRRLQQAQRG